MWAALVLAGAAITIAILWLANARANRHHADRQWMRKRCDDATAVTASVVRRLIMVSLRQQQLSATPSVGGTASPMQQHRDDLTEALIGMRTLATRLDHTGSSAMARCASDLQQYLSASYRNEGACDTVVPFEQRLSWYISMVQFATNSDRSSDLPPLKSGNSFTDPTDATSSQ